MVTFNSDSDRPMEKLSHSKKYGFIITNPPYGERLERSLTETTLQNHRKDTRVWTVGLRLLLHLTRCRKGYRNKQLKTVKYIMEC